MFDPVQHAKSYPFSPPDHGFLYEGGDWERLDPGRFDDERLEGEGRVPVLAAGSNQSPAQLKRKYGHLADAGMIPARRGVLHEFDVVYAAHLTGYGSVPATFPHSPGTAVTVFVLWLDEPQLARMHETEGNYTYDHLDGILYPMRMHDLRFFGFEDEMRHRLKEPGKQAPGEADQEDGAPKEPASSEAGA